MSADLVRLFVAGSSEAAARVLPQLRLYVVASLVVASGLALWLWAEHGFEI